MATVPEPLEAAAQLAQLEAARESGCLTIASSRHGECRIYLLGGQILLVEGSTGTGDAALSKALNWRDVTLSFDDKAELPAEPSPDQTIDTGPTTGDAVEPAPIGKLSDDLRLVRMARASLRTSLIVFAIPVVLIGLLAVAAVMKSSAVILVGALTALILFGVVAALWSALFISFRISFLRDAVNVPGGLTRTDVPHVVDAAAGVIDGKPHVVVSMRTRCAIGAIGRCRVEFFSEGIQIWRGPRNPVPRWQFRYRDLLQAESIDVITPAAAMGSPDQYLVRLIANQPRMAFLFGSVWFGTAEGQNRNARMLVNKLRQHRVPVFDDDFIA
jgi:hypothetical protein